MEGKKFSYSRWSKANKELHELYQNTMVTEEFKEKDAELTRQIDELKEKRRQLRCEETKKENAWVCEQLEAAGLI